jgi:type IV fimbrial biogenesis protein FimT
MMFSSRPHTERSQRGFTLIELMVTTAVIAIIALVAVPSFNNMRDQTRVRAAAEAIFAHVQFARSESIKQSRNLWVTATTGTDWCVGISNSSGCTCNTAGSCQFGPATGLMEYNVRFTEYSGITLTAGIASIQFDSRRGSVAGAGNSITVTGSNNFSAQIITSTMGRTRLCGNVGGGYPAC